MDYWYFTTRIKFKSADADTVVLGANTFVGSVSRKFYNLISL